MQRSACACTPVCSFEAGMEAARWAAEPALAICVSPLTGLAASCAASETVVLLKPNPTATHPTTAGAVRCETCGAGLQAHAPARGHACGGGRALSSRPSSGGSCSASPLGAGPPACTCGLGPPPGSAVPGLIGGPNHAGERVTPCTKTNSCRPCLTQVHADSDAVHASQSGARHFGRGVERCCSAS